MLAKIAKPKWSWLIILPIIAIALYERFIVDIHEPGNHNTGHLFDDAGVTIGRKLAEEEKLALIEFLKTQ